VFLLPEGEFGDPKTQPEGDNSLPKVKNNLPKPTISRLRIFLIVFIRQRSGTGKSKPVLKSKVPPLSKIGLGKKKTRSRPRKPEEIRVFSGKCIFIANPSGAIEVSMCVRLSHKRRILTRDEAAKPHEFHISLLFGREEIEIIAALRLFIAHQEALLAINLFTWKIHQRFFRRF
jgi:hypothetical protein